MYIPKTMKTKIASTFYDKEVTVLETNIVTDTEGGIKQSGSNVVDTFKGNVNFSSCKKIQEEYGLEYQIDISVTTNYDKLKHNDLIGYDKKIYNVTDIITCDSHMLIVGRIWRQ